MRRGGLLLVGGWAAFLFEALSHEPSARQPSALNSNGFERGNVDPKVPLPSTLVGIEGLQSWDKIAKNGPADDDDEDRSRCTEQAHSGSHSTREQSGGAG